MINGAKRARPLRFRPYLLHRLDVIVFPMPKVDRNLVFRGGGSRSTRRLHGRSGPEKHPAAIFREAERGLIVDLKTFSEPGTIDRDCLGCGRSFAVPDIELELSVAIADKS